MRIKIVSEYKSYISNPEFKKWLEDNAGKWVEVKTDYLFHDQYNVDKYRIMDNMVSAIEDDARLNKGKCNYCGALVEPGHEEEHFEDKENKVCEGCWWFRDRKGYKECNYDKDSCTNMECRKSGIDWFTPENTFFLRYPDGFSKSDKLIDVKTKFGSYYFEKSEGGYYKLFNLRKTIKFRYLEGEFILLEGNSYKVKKHLETPESVEKKVLTFLNKHV